MSADKSTSNHNAARKLAGALMRDMRGRSGFDIEVDAETEREWLDEWTAMIERVIESAATP